MTNAWGSGWAAQMENQSFKGRALALSRTGRAMGGDRTTN